MADDLKNTPPRDFFSLFGNLFHPGPQSQAANPSNLTRSTSVDMARVKSKFKLAPQDTDSAENQLIQEQEDATIDDSQESESELDWNDDNSYEETPPAAKKKSKSGEAHRKISGTKHQKKQETPDTINENAKELSIDEQIIQLAMGPTKQRFLELPYYFKEGGGLKITARHLEEDIKRAREERDRAKDEEDAVRLKYGPTKERILEVAQLPLAQRVQELPDVFTTSGVLRGIWRKMYQDDVTKANKEAGDTGDDTDSDPALDERIIQLALGPVPDRFQKLRRYFHENGDLKSAAKHLEEQIRKARKERATIRQEEERRILKDGPSKERIWEVAQLHYSKRSSVLPEVFTGGGDLRGIWRRTYQSELSEFRRERGDTNDDQFSGGHNSVGGTTQETQEGSETDNDKNDENSMHDEIVEVALMPPKDRHERLPDYFYPNGELRFAYRASLEGKIAAARAQQGKGRPRQKETNNEVSSRQKLPVLPANAPSKDRVLEVARMPHAERAKQLPDVFVAMSGKLKGPYLKLYDTAMKEQRAAIKASKAEGKRLLKEKESDTENPEVENEVKAEPEEQETSAKKPRLTLIMTNSRKQDSGSPSQPPPRQSGNSNALKPMVLIQTSTIPGSGDAETSATRVRQTAAVLNPPAASPITPVKATKADTPTPGYTGQTDQTEFPTPLDRTRQSIQSGTPTPVQRTSLAAQYETPYPVIPTKQAPAKVQRRLAAAEIVQLGSPSTPAQQPSSVSIPRPTQIPYSKILETEFGEDFLEDSDVLRPLNDLVGYVSTYTANVCTAPPPLYPRLPKPIREVDCVKNENGNSSEPLVVLLRTVFRVPIGMTILNWARSLDIDGDIALWVNSALVYMIREFVFRNGSPYQSTRDLMKTLKWMNIPAGIIAKIIQDTRLRAMKERSAEFSAKLESRHKTLVESLNNTMLPLVGTSSSILELHYAIATAAQELNLLIYAYKSTYQSIYPRTGDLFNGKDHTVNDKRLDLYVGQPILQVRMFGLKCNIGKDEWRVCQQAEVGMASDVLAPPPVSASKVPQKRDFEQMNN